MNIWQMEPPELQSYLRGITYCNDYDELSANGGPNVKFEFCKKLAFVTSSRRALKFFSEPGKIHVSKKLCQNYRGRKMNQKHRHKN